MVDYKMISSNLRAMREQRGVKQNFIAKQLGITASYYSEIENGHRRPQLDHILKLKKIFNVSLDDIFLNSEIAKCDVGKENKKVI